MLAVISPAKTLDFESDLPAHEPTQPVFLEQAEELVSILRQFSQAEIRDLMGVSENLAELNYDRYQEWSLPLTEDNARAALFAFKGDVYNGFELGSYGKRDLAFAQKRLRILSGLYGMLRPLDLMLPYRLEMGTALENPKGKDLYAFWRDTLTPAVSDALDDAGSRVLVNLASKEYFSALDPKELDAEIVTPQFKDLKGGKYKIVSFYAKKARGLMCDFMIRERIREPEELKRFEVDGYQFNPKLSEGKEWVFTRDAPPAAT